MKRFLLSILIFFCFSFALFSQIEIQSSLDSLKKRFMVAAGQEKLETLLELSKFYWNIDPAEGIKLAKHALGTAQTLGDVQEIMKSMYYLGTAYCIDNQLDNSLDYLLQAHQYARQHGFTKEIADISRQLGTVYYEAGKLNKSSIYTIQAYDIYKDIEDQVGVARCQNLLGLYYKGIGEYEKAIEHFEKSLAIGKQLSRKTIISSVLNDLGSMYAEIGNTRKAIDTYKEAVPYHSANGLNFKSGCFELKLADLYIKNGELSKAKYHLELGYKIAEKLNSKRLYRTYYRSLANYNTKFGNQARSVGAFQKLLAYQDSIADEQLRDKIEELDSRHAMSIKNKENQVLREQNQTQQLKITRQYIIGLLILLVFILAIFILIIRYRNNLKDNELLYLKNSLVHQHQEELIKAMKRTKISEEKLRVANDTKDKMFSLIAHDLRGAIGNISNGLRMYLGDEDLDLSEEDKQEFLQALFHSSDNAYELLENLLFWAKNQTSTLSANKQKVDASSIINSNIGLLSDLAKIKSIKLFTSQNPSVEVFVDWNMINTVLRNLISNAIKFTNKGGTVEIKSEIGQYFVKISVIDNGIGMSSEQVRNIYDGKTTDGTIAEKGTGLGLILCRDFLVENHGKMFVESKIDHGSTFSFIIPQKPMSREKYLELVKKEPLLFSINN